MGFPWSCWTFPGLEREKDLQRPTRVIESLRPPSGAWNFHVKHRRHGAAHARYSRGLLERGDDAGRATDRKLTPTVWHVWLYGCILGVCVSPHGIAEKFEYASYHPGSNRIWPDWFLKTQIVFWSAHVPLNYDRKRRCFVGCVVFFTDIIEYPQKNNQKKT